MLGPELGTELEWDEWGVGHRIQGKPECERQVQQKHQVSKSEYKCEAKDHKDPQTRKENLKLVLKRLDLQEVPDDSGLAGVLFVVPLRSQPKWRGNY